MKKLIFVLIALVISLIANAQNDTTVVNNNKVTFEKEEYYADDKYNEPNRKVKVEYYVLYDGESYPTNKTSYNRYYTIMKYNGQPLVAIITNKNKQQRIVVL